MAKRYTRKQLKKPDEFVSFWHKAYEAAAPYGRAIGLALLGGVVVLVLFWAFDHWSTGKREQATDKFAQATRIAEADLITDDNPAKPEVDKVPRFKSDKERMDAALAELDKIDKENPSSDVATRALLFRAGALYREGRYGDAEAAFKKYLDKAGADDSLGFLAREGIGLCAEAQNKLDDALSAYKALEPKSGDFFRDRALYDEGRVLMKKGDMKGAEAAYKDLLAKSPQTPLRDEVAMRLAQMGVAVPPPPSPVIPLGG